MILKELNDPSEIGKVLFDAWVYARIKDDLCSHIDPNQLPFDGYLYVGGYEDDRIIGLSVLYPYRDALKLHFMVLKGHLVKAREFLDLVLQLSTKIYCVIPLCYQSVINFALNNGFVKIELLEQPFYRNGTVHKRWLLCHS
jgi:hypothetical protein